MNWAYTQHLLDNLKASDARTQRIFDQMAKLREQEQQANALFQQESSARTKAMMDSYTKLEVQCIKEILKDVVELATGRIVDDGFDGPATPAPSNPLAIQDGTSRKQKPGTKKSADRTDESNSGDTKKTEAAAAEREAKAAAARKATELQNELNALN